MDAVRALRVVLWEESPGVLVAVGGNVSDDELLAAAESLRPATASEWEDLRATLAETGSPMPLPEPGSTVAIGFASDGSPWALVSPDGFGSLCLELGTGVDLIGKCETLSPEATSLLFPSIVADARYPRMAFGPAPAGSASVRILLAGGAELSVATVGETFYVAELPASAEPLQVVFLDAGGVEIGRL